MSNFGLLLFLVKIAILVCHCTVEATPECCVFYVEHFQPESVIVSFWP